MENLNATPAGTLQNLSGEFKATFTSDTVSGAARYQYQSQQLQNNLAAAPEYLDFYSTSSSSPDSQSITNDRRSIRIIFRSDLAPGTYEFPPEGAIRNVIYSEVQKVGIGFYDTSHIATNARLELKITEDGRRYSGKLDFDVLINGETLTVNSHFDVVLHFTALPSGQVNVSNSSSTEARTSDAVPQNITGKFNATFPTSLNPGETSFARAPYQSSSLSYDTLFLIPDINFLSRSGIQPLDSDRTSDARGFEIYLKKGVTSGTYRYPDPLSPITKLLYSEVRRIGEKYINLNFETLEATIELEVFDERRYVAKSLTMKARPPAGAILNINADFDIYLSTD